MEIIKQQDKPLSLLEKARQELAAFNSKQLSVALPASGADTKTERKPSHGERILYCSQEKQASAILILKLHEKGAEITDVIARRNVTAPVREAAQAAGSDLDTRELLLGNYRGCPHCRNSSVVLCRACGNLSCIASQPTMICPVCERSANVVYGEISLEVSCGKTGQQASSQTDQRLLTSPSGRPTLPYKPG